MSVHDLRHRRIDYDATTLDDGRVDDPLGLFATWLDDATRAQDSGHLYEATTMTLATAHEMPDGTWQPATRIVLLKTWDTAGFVFFSNHDSAKGRDLTANPRAGLLFHWPELQRQVRIEGPVSRTSASVSADYFAMRPRGSQVSAWASRQSEPVSSRRELEEHHARMDEQFSGAEVPCPPNWGGYVVAPERMEFWQGRPSRLHDRLVFTSVAGGWDVSRLCP